MSTTKKKPAAKSTTKKAPAKKSVAPKKRATTTRVVKKAPVVKSFKAAKEERPFMTFQLTKQSLYWLVLGIVVIAFTVWTLKLQSDIESLYDDISQTTALQRDVTPVKKQ